MIKPEDSNSFQSLSNHLLIAMPDLEGSEFANSVVYLCEHTTEGAMGLIVNKPLNILIEEVFDQLEIPSHSNCQEENAYYGGPVNIEHGFILHDRITQPLESTTQISNDICLTTSKDILNLIAKDQGPAHSLVILGYSGWGAGQLETEILQNAWLSVPCTPELLFNTPPNEQALCAAAQAGIDLKKMAYESGHA